MILNCEFRGRDGYADIEALKGGRVFFEDKIWVVWKVDVERATVRLENESGEKYVSLSVFAEAVRKKNT